MIFVGDIALPYKESIILKNLPFSLIQNNGLEI